MECRIFKRTCTHSFNFEVIANDCKLLTLPSKKKVCFCCVVSPVPIRQFQMLGSDAAWEVRYTSYGSPINPNQSGW